MVSPLPCTQEFNPHMSRTQRRLNECHVASLVYSTPLSCPKCHHLPQMALLLPLSLPVVICNNFCLTKRIIQSMSPPHCSSPLRCSTSVIFIYSPYCESLVPVKILAAQVPAVWFTGRFTVLAYQVSA